ncbi:uncharacterized protein LOC141900815 [Tubulanus polymorphus]|uniref:uncharacterized protein LOC141900815 n=1 Tax=Tubulanus polymorphus TaxID=672921 RepID=UPI003DA60C72
MQHAVDAGATREVIVADDTDVLLLLLYFKADIDATVLLISGKKVYDISKIRDSRSENILNNILGWHAITGYDTTSSFSGIGKKTALDIYVKHPELLSGIGRGTSFEKVEEFVCKMYDTQFSAVEEARVSLYENKAKNLCSLPPTRDALHYHYIRVNYQCKIWLNANRIYMAENPEETGAWVDKNGKLVPHYKDKTDFPDYDELNSCKCIKGCKAGCRCKKRGRCMKSCFCKGECCHAHTD